MEKNEGLEGRKGKLKGEERKIFNWGREGSRGRREVGGGIRRL